MRVNTVTYLTATKYISKYVLKPVISTLRVFSLIFKGLEEPHISLIKSMGFHKEKLCLKFKTYVIVVVLSRSMSSRKFAITTFVNNSITPWLTGESHSSTT